MDGTFHQEKPLDRLVGSQDSFSYDLKSATDRWPLVFMKKVLVVLFGEAVADTICTYLALNLSNVPFSPG